MQRNINAQSVPHANVHYRRPNVSQDERPVFDTHGSAPTFGCWIGRSCIVCRPCGLAGTGPAGFGCWPRRFCSACLCSVAIQVCVSSNGQRDRLTRRTLGSWQHRFDRIFRAPSDSEWYPDRCGGGRDRRIHCDFPVRFGRQNRQAHPGRKCGNAGRETPCNRQTAVRAPTATVWYVITDHPACADVADNISKVEVLSGDGLGMKRRCYGPKGENWEETCDLYEPGHTYGFRIHTEFRDYPYPFAELSGRWSVEEHSAGSEFNIKIVASLKGNALSRWLFATSARPQFKTILIDLSDAWAASMEREAETKQSTQRPRRAT